MPKHHSGQIRRTVSVSFSLPIELEIAVNALAGWRGQNRSQLIVSLLENELKSGGVKVPPRIPMRLRRNDANRYSSTRSTTRHTVPKDPAD